MTTYYQDFQTKMQRHEETNWLCKRAECQDGFSMSIQANECAYCSPRENSNTMSIYGTMEVGFPSEEESLILQYAEDIDRPTDTVYGYVPVEIIQEVINKHGGLVENQND